jgi:Xaa-Pro aminopeptidase
MEDDAQFVLVDAGGELHGYASDITRTYPIGGVFSKDHKTIYQIVLDAQKVCHMGLFPPN